MAAVTVIARWLPGTLARTAMDIRYRRATVDDASVLAPMNAQLIRDEGHRNSMSVAELRDRMATWLNGEYEAVIFESEGKAIGYALFRFEADHVYLRHLFVLPELRRKGIARSALKSLEANVWKDQPRVRIDVLVGNCTALDFWRAVGFADYCLTLERELERAR